MQRFIASLATSACLVALVGAAAPAHAAFATFVSGNGDDNNDCLTPATACRQLNTATGAIAKADANGIVHVLPGEYEGFFLDKSLDIVADGGQASFFTIAQAGGPTPGIPGIMAIGINVGASDVVRIRGFNLRVGHGIGIVGSGTIHIEDCTLTGEPIPSSYGIVYAPTGASELYVSGSTISRANPSNTGGILIRPTGSGSAKVVLDNDTIEDNAVGILVDGGGTSGSIALNVRDSVISGSTAQGLGVFEAVSGGPSNVVLTRTTISSNGGQGIVASRALASVRVRQSEITGNAVGVQSLNGGQIISHGDNVLAGNTTNGAFTSTVAPQ